METTSHGAAGIPARIAAAREAAGLTNEQLAARVNADRKSVERWQTRHGQTIKADRILALAQALDVDPTWLLVGEHTEVAS